MEPGPSDGATAPEPRTGGDHDARLRDAARTVALLARALERATEDLSLAQYRVLALVDAGDERASRVAQRLAVAKPTVTAVVDGLVERDWLRREAVDGDRRAARLCVTEAGRSVLWAAERAMATRLDELFAGVRDPDALLGALDEVGATLVARIDARLDAPGPADAAGGPER